MHQNEVEVRAMKQARLIAVNASRLDREGTIKELRRLAAQCLGMNRRQRIFRLIRQLQS